MGERGGFYTRSCQEGTETAVLGLCEAIRRFPLQAFNPAGYGFKPYCRHSAALSPLSFFTFLFVDACVRLPYAVCQTDGYVCKLLGPSGVGGKSSWASFRLVGEDVILTAAYGPDYIIRTAQASIILPVYTGLHSFRPISLRI